MCIIARGEQAVKETMEECRVFHNGQNQFISKIIADTTQIDKLRPKIDEFISEHGIPDYLVNVVGYALPKYIQDYTFEDYAKNMEVNFYGQLVPTLILLPYFIRNKTGHIANVSSVSGYMGMVGYNSYTPTKFAIVGWSEAMRHELKPYNINVSVLYPPDTETPGFKEENRSKPAECAMLSESGKLYPPHKIAEIFVSGILKRKFNIHAGSSKWISLVKRIAPKLFFKVIDHDYRKARQSLNKTA